MSFTPSENPITHPQRESYTELRPFRFWCQKVLPLVYDDTLSYYELLCKVVDYLNKTMEDVDHMNTDMDTLYSNFQSFQEGTFRIYNELVAYVNAYFENLDVQEEINNKLDDMVTSGELVTVLRPTIASEVTNWLNEHITPTTPAIDDTLTVSGAGADAKVTGQEINRNYSLAMESFYMAKDTASSLINTKDFENGGLLSNGKNNPDDVNLRVRTRGFIPVEENKTYAFCCYENSDIQFSLSFYTDDNYESERISASDWKEMRYNECNLVTIPSSAKFARITLKHRAIAEINVNDIANFTFLFYDNSDGVLSNRIECSNASIFADTGYLNKQNTNFVCFPFLNTGFIFIKDDCTGYVALYDDTEYLGKINSSNNVDKTFGNWKEYTGVVDISSIINEHNAVFAQVCITSNEITALNYKEWCNNNILFLNRFGDYIADKEESIKDYTDSNINTVMDKINNVIDTYINHNDNITFCNDTLLTIKDFEEGTLYPDGTNNDEVVTPNIRLRTKSFISVDELALYVIGFYNNCPYSISVSFYDENKFNIPRESATSWYFINYNDYYIFTVPSGAKYIRIIVKNGNDNEITVDSLKDYNCIMYKDSRYIEKLIHWGNGGLYADTGYVNRGSTNFVFSPLLNSGMILLPNYASGYVTLYKGYSYYGKINSSNTVDKVAGNWKIWKGIVNVSEILRTYECDYLMITVTDSNGNITANNFESWGAEHISVLNDEGLMEYLQNDILADYRFNLLRKEKITVENLNKQISGYQSFCKYNNNYYSTDGEKLYVQNSSFVNTNTVTMALGHGNSCQIGNSNLCYISGWDDDKLYIVNLDTLQIVNTITLPVSGYTTCAVDEANSLLYIFYRTTFPDSDDRYEFITYNYSTNTVVSRKYINTFKAMQACDYYNGLIIVGYGLGDANTGIYIYNTNGDVLEDYKTSVTNSMEIEGVYFDRSTKEIYFTTVNKNVYKIS